MILFCPFLIHLDHGVTACSGKTLRTFLYELRTPLRTSRSIPPSAPTAPAWCTSAPERASSDRLIQSLTSAGLSICMLVLIVSPGLDKMFHTVNHDRCSKNRYLIIFITLLPGISRKLFCQKIPQKNFRGISSFTFYKDSDFTLLRQSDPICNLSHEEQPVQQQVLRSVHGTVSSLRSLSQPCGRTLRKTDLHRARHRYRTLTPDVLHVLP